MQWFSLFSVAMFLKKVLMRFSIDKIVILGERLGARL